LGVATANSILLINFARDERLSGKNATDAALEAGTRGCARDHDRYRDDNWHGADGPRSGDGGEQNRRSAVQ